MSFSLNTLEFNQIKKIISKYTYSNKANEEINNLNPSNNYSFVIEEISKTNELTQIIASYGKLPFLEYFDNIVINNETKIERIYSLEEMLYLKLYLKMENDFLNYFSKIENINKYQYLSSHINLYNHTKLFNVFEKTFIDYGEIYDDATINLKNIRTKIKKLEQDLTTKMNQLLKTYEQYLSESIIVTRNNRYCLAVKESYKNKIKGVIHDISQTKQTIFIEPELSLQISAEIELQKILEEKEIIKILANISNLVDNNYETLKSNLINLINLDIIHAKAIYSLNINGIKPNINNEGIINLINAKHPLLDLKKAVPISLKLNQNKNTLLITGPNTGGKTVALKTIGLLTIMLQSGILIPVSNESNLAVFDNVFADIGDEQSIINSLSTFSSHIANIIYFINNLTNNSLILLDELGSGTDPNEGVALAIAIIEEFNKKDVRLVVTSHYSELKTYAYESDHILTASVAFDTDTLKPLYYLQHGITGKSHARLISRRLGMKEDVINRADELYSKRETDLAKIIEKLNEENYKITEERKQLLQQKNEYLNKVEQLKQLEEKLIKQQTDVIAKITEEEQAKWELKKEEVDQLIEKIKINSDEKHLLASLKGKLNEKVETLKITNDNEQLNIGNDVYIKPYQQYGKITNIVDDSYEVSFGIFTLNFKKYDLKKEKSKDKKIVTKKPRKNHQKVEVPTKTPALTVDLRGFRYEEVKEELDKAIDNCLLNNLHSLTIIHGFGTGAVRNAVYEYIKNSSLISSYRYGGENEGLNGVTIITLK